MTRAHPYVLDGTRLIVPLYSDGFSFSLMAITRRLGRDVEDQHAARRPRQHPAVAGAEEGRHAGRLHARQRPAAQAADVSRSTDRGETWSTVEDSDLPNPGSGAEVLVLANGNWVLIYNDLERGRYRLAVSLSEDEGGRGVDPPPRAGPRVDGRAADWPVSLPVDHSGRGRHAARDLQLLRPAASARRTRENRLPRKAIKHAHFNEPWIRSGDGD